ncbi:Protein of unknown function [Gryllus bimaculatus]|nr:Protein of unknown function [Gryllus bimaculatus]
MQRTPRIIVILFSFQMSCLLVIILSSYPLLVGPDFITGAQKIQTSFEKYGGKIAGDIYLTLVVNNYRKLIAPEKTIYRIASQKMGLLPISPPLHF